MSVDDIANHLNADKSVLKIKKALRSINFSNKEQIIAIARTLSDEGSIIFKKLSITMAMQKENKNEYNMHSIGQHL